MIVTKRDEVTTRFMATVEQMRAAQRAYFKTGGGIDDCRRLEREVDRQLAELRELRHETTQPKLF